VCVCAGGGRERKGERELSLADTHINSLALALSHYSLICSLHNYTNARTHDNTTGPPPPNPDTRLNDPNKNVAHPWKPNRSLVCAVCVCAFVCVFGVCVCLVCLCVCVCVDTLLTRGKKQLHKNHALLLNCWYEAQLHLQPPLLVCCGLGFRL